MKQYWVDVVRKETEFNRYSTWVEAESAEGARAKVREHYMEGGDTLTKEEQDSHQFMKALGIDSSEVVEIGNATEAKA
jgi:hypothetical protein